MDATQRMKAWLDSQIVDATTKQELLTLEANHETAEIEDRFYRDLEFGTGGLRGVMGAGTNRMNQYVIGKATQGLSNYLRDQFGTAALTRGVVVAYDTRNHSREFAQITVDVLAANGIKTYLFKQPVPTPELSFAVRHLQALAGIVITASHNPKEYNGYKVYDETGCQLVLAPAQALIQYVNQITDFNQVNWHGNPELQTQIDLTEPFVQAILTQSLNYDAAGKAALKIVYTPLHGTGKIPVMEVLQRDGFQPVLEPQQAVADGNFPTVKSPNPEEKSALDLGIKQAQATGSDLVLGTDPDSDRVGIAVRHHDAMVLLTGNQVGALLLDFICTHLDVTKLSQPAVVKTIVTNELGANIARKHGMAVFSTLTGFKFIGEKMNQFAVAGPQKRTFVMGYEESYGYLIGNHARDKDAVVSAMLICEMAAAWLQQGKTLIDRLHELYQEYGYYLDSLDSFTFKGQAGQAHIQQIMNTLRQREIFDHVLTVTDYTKDVAAEPDFGNLPKSNVLKFDFGQGTWLAARPSGTEPKIKFYYSVCASDETTATKRLHELKQAVQNLLKTEEA